MSWSKSGPVIPLAIGGLTLIGAIIWYGLVWNSVRNLATAPGRIVEIRTSRVHFKTDPESAVTYAPTFVFEDGQSITHRIEYRHFESPAQFKVGDSVVVLYDPDHPEEAELKSFMGLWGNPIGLMAASLVALFVGLRKLKRLKAVPGNSFLTLP